MNMTGNTILITGGTSGIGRGLAEAFHQRGNQVIIAGRRKALLEEVTAANPGMASIVLDVADPASIQAAGTKITADFPTLNVVINNAGIMQQEDVKLGDTQTADSEVVTNLLGTIRTTAALMPHLLKQANGAVFTVSSGLAFVPFPRTPTYSATKAAIHSYSMCLREQLKDTGLKVIEIAPPYVQTELNGPQQAVDPHAMPLADFITEVMDLIEQGNEEIIVEACKPLRHAAENGTIPQIMAGFAAMEL